MDETSHSARIDKGDQLDTKLRTNSNNVSIENSFTTNSNQQRQKIYPAGMQHNHKLNKQCIHGELGIHGRYQLNF